MNIKELIKEAHDNAVERGFYDCPECKGECKTTDEILFLETTCPVCNGTGINPNKNIGELLMLIVSELGEALEAHRCGRFAHDGRIDIWTDEGRERILNAYCFSWEDFENEIKDTFEDEIADVFIRLFDFMGYRNIKGENIQSRLWGFDFQHPRNTGSNLLEITYLISLLNKKSFEKHFNYEKEFGEILNALDTFCKSRSIPIEKHIKAKMAYNRTRPRKHGKEY